jgi:flagellar M-ring protein FliF
LGVNGILATLRGFGPARLGLMAAVAAGILVGLVVLSSRLATPSMALLFGDLDLDDSGRIVAKLEQMKVPFELRGNGAQVYVPEDQALRLRLSMAEEGIPAGGSLGYELFDRADSLGATSFVQNLNHLRALEGELARTIRTIERVQLARVHLVMPKRELFARDQRQPSASIILKMKGSNRLSPAQVQAVQHLIAAAVPDLDPGRVSIVDDHGSLLSRAGDGDGATSANLAEARSGFETKMKAAIERLLEQSVGPGASRAEVSAELNFDRVTTNHETFDPESQVARSTQTREETSASTDADGEKTVSVANNLPDAKAEQGQGRASSSKANVTEETVNYEISKIVKTQVHETGTVKRVSVAVLVDGTYGPVVDGQRAYRPREQAELDKLASLVKSAIGFDEKRGDRVEIVNMQFARADDEPAAEESAGLLGLGKSDYIRLGELGAFVLVAILAMLLVLRPMLTRRGGMAGAAALPAGLSHAQLPPPGGTGFAAGANGESAGEQGQPSLAATQYAPAALSGPEQMIDIARIEGQVRASSIKKISELVGKHPEEAIAIMRSWLYQSN